MFVFPAFDANYKTRKRSYRCCQNCRIKKVKCEIKSTESNLCSNCRKHNWNCDLNKIDKSGNDNDNMDQKLQVASNVERNGDIENIESIDKRNGGIKLKGYVDATFITPQYLKDKFNFNISSKDGTSLYQYLCHGHPKAVIGNKMEDESVWHESGVYIKEKSDGVNTLRDNSKQARKSNFHIRNRKVYDILVSIDAFTLSTEYYPFTDQDIRELLQVYFYKINSLFPIVEEKAFWINFDLNEAPTVIVYAMILAILRDKLAEPILKRTFIRRLGITDIALSESDFIEDLIEFLTDLEYKIRQVTLILPQLGDIDKITLLVELLLLTFHYNFDRLGNEQSSHDLTDAINLAVSSGIHMKRLSDNVTTKEEIEYTTNLWWCCYIIDRFNALTNSRCIFIKQEDFNIDLPYSNTNLLKLVQLAQSLENMTIAIYQPFDNINNTPQRRNKVFNIDEFQKLEFEFCENERIDGILLNKQENLQGSEIIPSKDSIESYTATSINFLTRLVNNTIILFSQKAKYDDVQIPNHIPESVALEASKNILRYVLQIKDDAILSITLIPWCVSLGMAVALKKKAKYLLSLECKQSEVDDCEVDLQNYISVLEIFSKRWWVVDEICKLTKEFVEKLNKSTTLNKRNMREVYKQDKRHKYEENKFSKYLGPPNTLSNNHAKNSQNNDDEINTEMKHKPILSILNILNENFEENNSPFEINSVDSANQDINNYVVNKNDTNLYNRLDAIPQLSDQYHDFLESMHIDLFDNDFLKDFPNIVNHLMEGD